MLEADAEPLGPLEEPLSGLVGPQPGDLVADYVVLGELGVGGMGRVYEARQRHPDRLVALKTVHPWLRGERAMAAFRAEAQAMSGLLHPNIPQVYAAFEVEGEPWLAMERVWGRRLDQATAGLDRRGRIALMERICRVIGFAHARGVVHRDLKPENILIGDDGQPKILDFGVALVGDGGVEGLAGTAPYLAPERSWAEGDARADVFSLGVMLEASLGVGAPVDLSCVVARATARDPGARQDDAGVLANDLRAHLEHRVGSSGPFALGWRVRQGLRRRWRWLTLAGVLGLAIGLRSAARQWQDWRHQLHARQRWETVLPTLESLRRSGEHAGMEALLSALVEDPSLQGTQAHGEVMLWRARDQGDVEGWGQAILTAATQEQEQEALLGLARALAGSGAVERADALYRSLPFAPLEERIHARTSHLHFAEALAMDPGAPTAPLLEAWSGWSVLPEAGKEVVAADLDGDGVDELWSPGAQGALLQHRIGAPALAVPAPEGILSISGSITWRGHTHLIVGYERGSGLLSLEAEGLRPSISLVPGANEIGSVRVSRQHGSEILLIVGQRGASWAVYPGERTSRVVQTDLPPSTFVGGLASTDLDGDGVDEVLIGLRDVLGLELRALRWEGNALRTIAQRPTGRPRSVLSHAGHDGRQIVVVEDDGYWPPALGPRPRPSVRTFRASLDLTPLSAVVWPGPWSAVDNMDEAIDLDGDGLEDLVLLDRVLRQLPGGGYAELPLVPGGIVRGVQLDADPALELMLQRERGVWIAGTGDGPPPDASAPEGLALPELSNDQLEPRVRRALRLAEVGSWPVAVEALVQLSRQGQADAPALSLLASELLERADAPERAHAVLEGCAQPSCAQARARLDGLRLAPEGEVLVLDLSEGLPEGWSTPHPELLEPTPEGLRIRAWAGAGELLGRDIELGDGPLELSWELGEVQRERNAALYWGIGWGTPNPIRLGVSPDPATLRCLGRHRAPTSRATLRVDPSTGRGWCGGDGLEMLTTVPAISGRRQRLSLVATGAPEEALSDVIVRRLAVGGARLLAPDPPVPATSLAQLLTGGGSLEVPELQRLWDQDPGAVRLALRLRPLRLLSPLRQVLSAQELGRLYAEAWAVPLLRDKRYDRASGLAGLELVVDDDTTAALELARAEWYAREGELALALDAAERVVAGARSASLRARAHAFAAGLAAERDPERAEAHQRAWLESCPSRAWCLRVLEASGGTLTR